MATRKKIIIGNWKMNNGPKEGIKFISDFNKAFGSKKAKADYAIAAPFTTLPFLMNFSLGGNKTKSIPLAAQNVSQFASGAYTGEVSLTMLSELDIKYVIIGHSERRQYFNETNKSVNEKVIATLKTSITPVMAFGETLKEFESNKTMKVIEKQLLEGLKNVEAKDFERLVLAYEPIWAIGTGKTATSKQAQDVIAKSRKIISSKFGKKAADAVRIQYGGSVNPKNISELMKQKDIDGALVGGASLKVEDFISLITYK